MKTPKLKFKKIGYFFKKLPRIFGEHAFLTFLGLLVAALIWGGFIFYQYSILIERAGAGVPGQALKFNEKVYQEVLQIWQEKEKRFEKTNLKEYPDLFREIKEKVQNQSPIPPAEGEGEGVSELSDQKVRELKATINLFQFYLIKGEYLPLISERAKIWEEKGLGTAEGYQGLYFQNTKLLEELKKELTQ